MDQYKIDRKIADLRKNARRTQIQGKIWLIFSAPLCLILGILVSLMFLGLIVLFIIAGLCMLQIGKSQFNRADRLEIKYYGKLLNGREARKKGKKNRCKECGAETVYFETRKSYVCTKCGHES